MKLDAFLTLDAVLRGGTLAAAAAEMDLTPSAVSMKMKQLEVYMGQPLFDRSGLQVRPTPLAHDVSVVMRGALQQIESLRKRPGMSIEGVVRLGVIESMQPVLLPGVLRSLRDRYPLLDVRPTRGRSTGLVAALKAGELDAALVAQPERGASSRLRWQPMLRRELVLIAPPGAEESSVAALFRQHEWIRYDRGTVTGMLAARYVNAHVKDKRGEFEFDTVAAIVAMVSAGLGVSLVQLADPKLCQIYPVRIVRLGRGAPALQLSLVTRKADDDDRALGVLREAMTSVCIDAQRRRTASGV
ncbi:MAG: LysR family transcriptional regulator [Variovorax sp.]|jgi:DNA-binding transcriptional LysR family regulator|nr:MAG: LysR family transcriptional regulator [Variovorax sp.]